MVDKYFVNCRGATFNKVHTSEWDNSGGLPRLASPFAPYREDFNNELMTFVGSNKSANWINWNSTEASNQLDHLKKIGVNLIRVYGDLFCWAQFKTKYLSAVDQLSQLCNQKKMYIQWVLFDGYTEGDTSSTGHELGYFDPSTPCEAVAWGIKRWQRCPNINENDLSQTHDYWQVWSGLPTRTPSSMTVSGDAYVTDMVNTAGKYRSTLSWEVMHDVNILSTEASGYDFLTSAINKVNSLKSATQKTTFSAKYINALSAPLEPLGTTRPDVYVSGIVEKLTPLVDYVCDLTTNFTTPGFINSYLRLKDFSTKTGKPVMIIDSFNDSLVTPFDLFTFSKDFTIGSICEGLVDRAFSRKPYNALKGVLYDDGSARRAIDASSIIEKAKRYISPSKLTVPDQKSEYDTLSGNTVASSYSRFNNHGTVGHDVWSSIYEAVTSFPEYSGIPIGYAAPASSVSSSYLGWGIVGDASSYQGSSLFTTLEAIRTELINNPLQDFGDDVARDKFGHKILTRLIKLTQDLDMHKGHNYYNTTNYTASDTSGFIASSYQEAVFSSASAYMPKSLTKSDANTASPFIGTPRYFSSIALADGFYRDNSNYFQKPLCYWTRDGSKSGSGACHYSQPINLEDTDGSSVDIVGSYIDWTQYTTDLQDWADNLYDAYVNFNNNLRDYLINTLGDSRVSNYLVAQSYLP